MPKIDTRSESTINRILDGAAVCFQRSGLNKTTMSDIIAESGLARTTVYRHFKVRDDIISQLVLRDIDYLAAQLDSIRDQHRDDIEREIAEVIYFALSEIVQRPLLNALFTQDPVLLNKLGLTNNGVMQYIQRAVQPVFNKLKSEGRLRKGITLEEYAEWNGRFAMSFVLAPYAHQGDPKKMRRYIRNFILPSLLIHREKVVAV